MALDATIGGTTSDSYITVADADTYQDTNLNTTDWTGASAEDKERALKMATRLLDERMDWIGLKASSDQALRWPRSSVVDPDHYAVESDSLPAAITNATAEFAKHLLADDLTGASDGKGLKQVKADKISVSFNPGDRLDVFPEIVHEMLIHWGTPRISRGGMGVVKVIR